MKVLVSVEVDTELDLSDFRFNIEKELIDYFGNKEFSLYVEDID